MAAVAASAGVSQTTVSLILGGREDARFAPATRARVIEAARALGYRARRRRSPAASHRVAPARAPSRARDLAQGATAGPSDAGGEARAADRRVAATPGDGVRPAAGPARRRSQTDEVVRSLGVEIVSGMVTPGERLPGDAALMARFRVSRTVLREAARVLSGKGLLVSKAGTGTLVRDPHAWNLFDADILGWQAQNGGDGTLIAAVEEIRWALEPEAAALAAARRGEADVATLHALVDRMAAPHASSRTFVEADHAFHSAVAAASGNPFLRSIGSLIRLALVAALTESWPGDEPGGTARSAADHRRIVEAIAGRDADAARETMRAVIREGMWRQARARAARRSGGGP